MNDTDQTGATVRPSKKQRELLNFIEVFIAEHGYSPSYREIMTGLNYSSVATVALHVKNLIARGHLRKRDRSARSLEVVKTSTETDGPSLGKIAASEEKWLVDKVHEFIEAIEAEAAPAKAKLDELYVLLGAMSVLGLEDAARSFLPRLQTIKERIDE
jgi:SOS-response transcriptional repressor LexA